MRDMMMVPASEFERMRQRHIQQATTNTVLEKVGDLGATEDAILQSNLPASMAIALVNPLERRRRTLTKRLRTGGERGNSYGADSDPEPLVNTPAEALVKKLITKVGKTNRVRRTLPTPPPATPRLLPTPPATPRPRTPGTARPFTVGPSRLPRPITARQKPTKRLQGPDKTPKSRPGFKQAAIKGASKSVAKALGFYTRDKDTDDDSDEELSPLRTRGQRVQDGRLLRRPQQPKSWEAYQEKKRSKKK